MWSAPAQLAANILGATRTIRLLDLPDQQPLTIRQAAALIGKMTGRTPYLNTVYRWCVKGTRGVKLQSFCVGRIRFVTVAALERFIDLCSADRPAADAIVSIDVTPHRSPEVSRQSERRAREIEEARQRLDQVTNRREKQRAGKQSGPNQSA